MIFVPFKQTKYVRSALGYAASSEDHAGRPRDPESGLLHGHRVPFELLGDRCNERLYTNFCCTGTWSFTDVPSRALLGRIREAFIHTLVPGVPTERVAAIYYYHYDHGHPHVHFAVLAIDLATGKRFTAYVDRKDRVRFRLLAQLINDFWELDDPNDPARKRGIAPAPFGSKKAYKDDYQLLSDAVWFHCCDPFVRNQSDLCGKLEEGGWIIRSRGANHLSAALGPDRYSVKLRGACAGGRWHTLMDADAEDEAVLRWREGRLQRIQDNARYLLQRLTKRAAEFRKQVPGPAAVPRFWHALSALSEGYPDMYGLFAPVEKTRVRAPITRSDLVEEPSVQPTESRGVEIEELDVPRGPSVSGM